MITQIPEDTENLVKLISNNFGCIIRNYRLRIFRSSTRRTPFFNRQISIENPNRLQQLFIELQRIVLHQCHLLTGYCSKSRPHKITSILNKSLPALYPSILMLIGTDNYLLIFSLIQCMLNDPCIICPVMTFLNKTIPIILHCFHLFLQFTNTTLILNPFISNSTNYFQLFLQHPNTISMPIPLIMNSIYVLTSCLTLFLHVLLNTIQLRLCISQLCARPYELQTSPELTLACSSTRWLATGPWVSLTL